MRRLLYLLTIIFSIGVSCPPTQAASDNSAAELTIEMRDGTRVVGRGSGDGVNFKSSQMGELKLKWPEILSIESPSNGDFAKLILRNGDVCQVHFEAETITIETSFGPKEIPVKQIKSLKSLVSHSPILTKAGPLFLTIELQDGSRIIGTIHDDTLNFKSTTVGEVKLPWADIRTVEGATATKSARLIARNGDEFSVDISTQILHLETVLGKIDLPVKLIRRIHVSRGDAAGEHLVGWWKLDEGTGTIAKDSCGGENPHDATINNAAMWTQSPDDDRCYLTFNGGNQNVSLGNILQGAYSEISVACWVKVNGKGFQTVVERSVWDNADGLGIAVDSNGITFGHYGNTNVRSKSSICDGQWHHLVGTLAQTTGGYTYSIYIDGDLDNSVTLGQGLSPTSSGWILGSGPGGGYSLNGQLKDLRIYDCALSSGQVIQVYSEDDESKSSSAKPPSAPVPQKRSASDTDQ